MRDAVREIGYVNDDDVFHADKIFVKTSSPPSRPTSRRAWMRRRPKGKKTAEQGAGDQGFMFGYACNETPELMPAPIMFAHRLGRELTHIRKSGKAELAAPGREVAGLGDYEDGKPVGISNVVISTQHAADVEHAEIEKFCIEKVIKQGAARRSMLNDDTEYLINPTGRFVVGGPQGDTGLTGRKIIVDTYGGMGRHGGGAFSGKDPPRSTAAPPTWAAGWRRTSSPPASPTKLRGPVRLRHRPSRAGQRAHRHLRHRHRARRSHRARVLKVFTFKPADIVEQLNLLRPIY